MALSFGENPTRIPGGKVIPGCRRDGRPSIVTPPILLEVLPIPVAEDPLEHRTDLDGCRLQLVLQKPNAPPPFRLRPLAFQHGPIRHGLGRLAPCLVPQGARQDPGQQIGRAHV